MNNYNTIHQNDINNIKRIEKQRRLENTTEEEQIAQTFQEDDLLYTFSNEEIEAIRQAQEEGIDIESLQDMVEYLMSNFDYSPYEYDSNY